MVTSVSLVDVRKIPFPTVTVCNAARFDSWKIITEIPQAYDYGAKGIKKLFVQEKELIGILANVILAYGHFAVYSGNATSLETEYDSMLVGFQVL